MTTSTILAGGACVLFAALHAASLFAAGKRWRRSGVRGRRYADALTILRPVCGLENFSRETLASSFTLEHRAVEILFCVARETDPVTALVRELIAAHPGVDARLLVGDASFCANPKLNNIAKGWAAARHPWVAMADCNVLLPLDYAAQLFDAWRDDCALVSSPPIATEPDGAWAELECAFLNTHEARWQSFAAALGLGFAQGKTLFWRKDFLDANGGVAALACELAEDAAATKLARARGLRVSVLDRPVEQPIGRRGAREVWARQMRWARLRFDTFPLLFMPEILAGGLWPLLACALFAHGVGASPLGACAAYGLVWYGAEALLAQRAGLFLSMRGAAMLVLRDAMLPILWLGAVFGRELVWRGTSLRDAPGELDDSVRTA